MAVAEWTTNPYPRPRLDRRAGAAPPEDFAAFPPSPPRTLPFTFVLSEIGADQRGTVGTRRIAGPALLKRCTVDMIMPTDSGDKSPLLQIFYSASPIVAGVNQAEAFPAGCTNICETQFQRNDLIIIPAGQAGFAWGVNAAALVPHDFLIDVYVPLPEFFIGVSIINRSNAGGTDAVGLLLIYENVDAEWWRSLLG